MLGILVVVLLALWITFWYPIFKKKDDEEHSENYNLQMKKLWSAAQGSMKENKTLRAEKALLTILKFDEKNAAAYNRLGILYAKEQKFDEAIECFEIAQSLDNNPSSLHNVGLIYLETGAFEKAAMAFEQAIDLEDNIAARYIALAKAREKLGQNKAAVDALEKAYLLDKSVATLRLILAIHENTGDLAAISDTTARIEKQIEEVSLAKAKAKRPKRTATTRASARPTARRTSVVRKTSAKPVKSLTNSTAGSASAIKRPVAVRKATAPVKRKPVRKIQ